MYGFAQTLNGKHAGRRLSDAAHNKTNFDLPAKVFILSVALGKIVGVLGNEARMVVSLVKSWSTTL